MTNRIHEIRWHGRGGQGAVTAARIVAEAAYIMGYSGVTATPSFGAERRGVPVSASTRISLEPIRILSQVVEPEIVVVIDQTLLTDNEVVNGLSINGWLIVNSNRSPGDIEFDKRFKIATADASSVCQDLGLVVAGITMVNIAMLGALVYATELVDIESVTEVINKRFSDSAIDVNLTAIRRTYEITEVNNPG